MTGPDTVRQLVREIVERRGNYWLAKQLGGTHCTRVTRMLVNGRCQPHEWEIIKSLHAQIVPCETSHSVTNHET